MEEKFVVFRRNGTLYLTSKENYDAVIQDASAITKLEGFNNYDEVAEYFWKWKRTPKSQIINMTDERR